MTAQKRPEPVPGQQTAPNPTPKQCACKPERQILRDGSLMETHQPYCQVKQKTQVFR